MISLILLIPLIPFPVASLSLTIDSNTEVTHKHHAMAVSRSRSSSFSGAVFTRTSFHHCGVHSLESLSLRAFYYIYPLVVLRHQLFTAPPERLLQFDKAWTLSISQCNDPFIRPIEHQHLPAQVRISLYNSSSGYQAALISTSSLTHQLQHLSPRLIRTLFP